MLGKLSKVVISCNNLLNLFPAGSWVCLVARQLSYMPHSGIQALSTYGSATTKGLRVTCIQEAIAGPFMTFIALAILPLWAPSFIQNIENFIYDSTGIKITILCINTFFYLQVYFLILVLNKIKTFPWGFRSILRNCTYLVCAHVFLVWIPTVLVCPMALALS